MEVDKKDEKADENKFDDMVCTMEDCKSKTSISCTGKNLTQMVGNLRLKVPCKNRDAGCPHKCVEDEMEEHEDKCGIEKSDVTLAARIFLSRTCFITSEMNIKRILKPRSG